VDPRLLRGLRELYESTSAWAAPVLWPLWL
jgi:hypothetical protein